MIDTVVDHNLHVACILDTFNLFLVGEVQFNLRKGGAPFCKWDEPI